VVILPTSIPLFPDDSILSHNHVIKLGPCGDLIWW
jgi:hypothetical protein